MAGLHTILASGLDHIIDGDDVIVTGDHDALVDLCNGFLELVHGGGAQCERLVDGFHLSF